jgi:hypothetical protein
MRSPRFLLCETYKSKGWRELLISARVCLLTGRRRMLQCACITTLSHYSVGISVDGSH